MHPLTHCKIALLPIAAAAISGCTMLPQSDFNDLSPSRDHYRISATVPDGHIVTATTIYKPANGSCPEDTEAYDWKVSRQRAELDRTKPTSENEYSFKSPMSINILGCQLNAAHSHLTLTHDYGDDTTRDDESMYFLPEAERPYIEERHESLSSLNQNRVCTYTFYIRRASSQLVKRLDCVNESKETRGFSPAFLHDEMKDKTIHYTFSLNPEDVPSFAEGWIKTPDGYRPCVEKGFTSRCEDPPELRQFEINGQRCDIYPGCTLPERQ